MCQGAFLLLAGVFLWRRLYLEYKSTNLLLFTQFGITWITRVVRIHYSEFHTDVYIEITFCCTVDEL